MVKAITFKLCDTETFHSGNQSVNITNKGKTAAYRICLRPCIILCLGIRPMPLFYMNF